MRRRIHNVGQVFNLPALNVQVENLPHGSSRAGFSLLEMFVAAVVFGTALVTFLPMMQSVGFQQRLTGQRLLALREAENLLEEIAPQAWSELTQEFVESQSLSDEAKSRLPQCELDIDVSEPAEPAASKQVTVRVSWTPRSGQAPQSVRLAAWFFDTEGQP
ncbi:hypothetical protein LBMAG52_11890 [Planctomycetia bacterium]|nr:hypothetical protein LBMAG52_11890 [Planctomycetia bacterium]